MNQVSPTADVHAGATSRAPRIYYVNPLLVGPLERWSAVLDRAAGLGFTELMTGPVFAASRPFLPADFDRLHAVFESDEPARTLLGRLAERCAARGLDLLLDIPLAAAAADGPVVQGRPELFHLPDPARALDPRSYDANGDAARARFDTAADALAPWWAQLLASWVTVGVAGFRFLGLEHVPPAALAAILAGARGAGDVAAYGWTPGLAAEQQSALAGSGLDHVFSSLPFWDCRADWLWAEYARLARVAPVVMPVAVPFARRRSFGEREAERLVALAAAIGDGWMMPMEFASHLDLEAAVTAANRRPSGQGLPRIVHGGGPALAVLRTTGNAARSPSATLVLANLDLEHPRLLPLDGLLGRYTNIALDAGETITLAPGEVRSETVHVAPEIVVRYGALADSARKAADGPRVAIENVTPSVEDGLFPAKRVAGELVRVQADIISDGHDKLGVALLWQAANEDAWSEVRMRPLGNDRWQGEFPLDRVGRYTFTVEAWRDAFASFRDELAKKNAAGIDVRLEAMEGGHLVEAAAVAAPPKLRPALQALGASLKQAPLDAQVKTLLSDEVAALMAQADARPRAVRPGRPFPIEADRPEATFASWYEIFPRSMSDDARRHGTFADVVRHLPRIRDMGFDVLYFPPIHPIGRMNRKGPNNALRAEPGDVGSPYAIGGEEGGHDAIHPQLGTLEDFRHLMDEAAKSGLEIAIDFAIQCSPDHPWLKQHHDWFAWRPDGSMKFAENPPKKYEDIVNVDFYAPSSIPDLWVGLCEVVLFWAKQGVRIFRVDNPHTKPLPFWEWMIREVRAQYPDSLFLAEAFTRPKVMNRLGKVGFSQSYTYFTWRNTKAELTEYLTELSAPPVSDFFRPNFFVNTPDINPIPLQTAGREGFLARATLAATLSGLWGVYCGFELCEGTPLPGREEYMDSEKYQIRVWDWDRPGNIVADIARLNQIRRCNPALQTHLGVTFLPAGNEQILFYEKATRDRSNVVLVAVNLMPAVAQSADIELPLWKWSLPDHADIEVDDLLHDTSFTWSGKRQRVTLDASTPCAIWRARPKG